ncbi:MAG TPA: flavin reductase family protein [Gaiellales bacterium]|jgi:flavin reductase (DIM6/NTAB) family NADH-FMN oxidoreductase RutF|nr:flavin reductase family protein [Gaiellales bacterium]
MDDAQRERFDHFAAAGSAPLYIVTVADGEDRYGCLVGFASQTSIDPPRFLTCISVANATHRHVQRAAELAVHQVPADRRDLAELFGGTTADEGADKFQRCRWTAAPGGLPVLDDCPTRMIGAVVDRHPLGDHTGLLLRPLHVEADPARPPLLGASASDIEPGHPA